MLAEVFEQVEVDSRLRRGQREMLLSFVNCLACAQDVGILTYAVIETLRGILL